MVVKLARKMLNWCILIIPPLRNAELWGIYYRNYSVLFESDIKLKSVNQHSVLVQRFS